MIRQIWALTRKELRLWVQRPGEWLVLFVVPLLFIWAFGATFGNRAAPVVSVFVVNEDSGRAGREVMAALKVSDNLDLEVLSTRAEADRRVGRGERMAAVVIPAGFTGALGSSDGAVVDLIVDPARSESAAIVTGLVNQALAPIIIDAEVSRGVNQGLSRLATENSGGSPDAQKLLGAALEGVVDSQVQDALDDPLIKLESVPGVSSASSHPPTLMEYLVPGYIMMFVFFLVNFMVTTLVFERSQGTLRRLLTSPASRGTILAGKVLPYVILSFIQIMTLLAVSHYIFGVSLGRSPEGLALLAFACAAVVSGFGIMLSALVRTEGQAGSMTVLFILLMAAVSGSMFPGIRIPGLEMATPHYWAINAFQGLVSRGLGLQGILLPVGVLLSMSAVFFGIGVARFKFE